MMRIILAIASVWVSLAVCLGQDVHAPLSLPLSTPAPEMLLSVNPTLFRQEFDRWMALPPTTPLTATHLAVIRSPLFAIDLQQDAVRTKVYEHLRQATPSDIFTFVSTFVSPQSAPLLFKPQYEFFWIKLVLSLERLQLGPQPEALLVDIFNSKMCKPELEKPDNAEACFEFCKSLPNLNHRHLLALVLLQSPMAAKLPMELNPCLLDALQSIRDAQKQRHLFLAWLTQSPHPVDSQVIIRSKSDALFLIELLRLAPPSIQIPLLAQIHGERESQLIQYGFGGALKKIEDSVTSYPTRASQPSYFLANLFVDQNISEQERQSRVAEYVKSEESIDVIWGNLRLIHRQPGFERNSSSYIELYIALLNRPDAISFIARHELWPRVLEVIEQPEGFGLAVDIALSESKMRALLQAGQHDRLVAHVQKQDSSLKRRLFWLRYYQNREVLLYLADSNLFSVSVMALLADPQEPMLSQAIIEGWGTNPNCLEVLRKTELSEQLSEIAAANPPQAKWIEPLLAAFADK